MSFGAIAVMPEREFVLDPGPLGLGTTLQALPFQCSWSVARGRPGRRDRCQSAFHLLLLSSVEHGVVPSEAHATPAPHESRLRCACVAAHGAISQSLTPTASPRPRGLGSAGVTSDPERWQLGGSAPELYERYLVPTVTMPWAEDLVDRVGVSAGDRVLDVACGTGVVARVAAARVGESGRVAGLDLNAGMLDVARATPPVPAGPSIEWLEGSALALPFGDGEFGIVLCQLGLQFFDDRLGALREMRRVLADAGRAGASVFASIDRNPAAAALSAALDRQLGEGASLAKRSEHSLANPEELRELFAAAGFGGARVETVTRTVRFRSPTEWVQIQLAATPLASLLRGRERPERDDVVARLSSDVSASLGAFAQDDAFAFPQEVHVALATV
jgi:ubiquinone/menaquinone biosynthesis C-methylase UbiE